VLEELNIQKLSLTTNKVSFGVKMKAEPDHKVLGLKFKKDFKKILAAVKALTDEQIEECLAKGGIELEGEWIQSSEMYISYDVNCEDSGNMEVACSGSVLFILKTLQTQELKDEGTSREIINRIQKLRKKAGLVPTDPISVQLYLNDELHRVMKGFQTQVESALKCKVTCKALTENHLDDYFISEEHKIGSHDLIVAIICEDGRPLSNALCVCPYVNVVSLGLKQQFWIQGNRGTILLENPKGRAVTLDEIKRDVKSIFGLKEPFALYQENGKVLADTVAVNELNKKILFAGPISGCTVEKITQEVPFVRFRNVSSKTAVLLENPVGTPTLDDTIVALDNKELAAFVQNTFTFSAV
jgi:isoleucyl-tRNA synthetase